jgi:hypothetical protein
MIQSDLLKGVYRKKHTVDSPSSSVRFDRSSASYNTRNKPPDAAGQAGALVPEAKASEAESPRRLAAAAGRGLELETGKSSRLVGIAGQRARPGFLCPTRTLPLPRRWEAPLLGMGLCPSTDSPPPRRRW